MGELNRWAAFEDFTREVMEEEHIVGLAVSVGTSRGVVYEKGFGYRDLERKLPVTPLTVFGIASVSKSFTSAAIMKLQEQGLIKLDDPVVQYIPGLKVRGLEDPSLLKIGHLLSHTSGIPPLARHEEFCTFEQHVAYISEGNYDLLGQPGEYFSYSNDCFLLLGAIIQNVSGMLYRRFMTRNLLDALGMYRSTYSLEEIARMDDVTVPYLYQEASRTHVSCAWPKLGNYEVGGGVRSCARDLQLYGRMYLTAGRGLLSKESVQQMTSPRYKIARQSYYGLALKVTPDYGGCTLVEHGGSQPGVSSNFGFIPEADVTISVLCNTSGVPADRIWLAAANSFLGFPMDKERSREPISTLPISSFKHLEGIYSCDEGGRVQVDVGEEIRVEAEGYRAVARPSGPDTLVFYRSGKEEVLKFFARSDGSPWAVLCHMRMMRKVE